MAAEQLRFLARCLCLVILMSSSASSTQDYAELVARLYRQAVRDNKPLVVVLDRNRPSQREVSSSSSDEEINGLGKLLKQLSQRQMHQPVRHEHGRFHNYQRLPKNHRLRALLQQFADKRERHQVQQPRYQVPKQRQQRHRSQDNVLEPKYVVKSLLNLRNSLNCNAQDKCKRRCVRNALRSQIGKCQVKCEVTFTCEPKEEEKDETCVDSDDCKSADSCEGDDCDEEENPSTRSPPSIDSCAEGRC